jgi:hypothetical protein
VSGWIFIRFAQQFSQAADVGQSIKQFTNEDPNHGFELGLTDTSSWTSTCLHSGRQFCADSGLSGDIYKG